MRVASNKHPAPSVTGKHSAKGSGLKPANYTPLPARSLARGATHPKTGRGGGWRGEEARGSGGPSGGAGYRGAAGGTSEGEAGPCHAGSRARLTFCAAFCCSTFCSTVMAPAAPAATQAAASDSSRPRWPWLPRSAELQGAARTAGEDSAPASQARRRRRQACAGTAGWRRGADSAGHGGDPATTRGPPQHGGPPRPGPWAGGGRRGAGGREGPGRVTRSRATAGKAEGAERAAGQNGAVLLPPSVLLPAPPPTAVTAPAQRLLPRRAPPAGRPNPTL